MSEDRIGTGTKVILLMLLMALVALTTQLSVDVRDLKKRVQRLEEKAS